MATIASLVALFQAHVATCIYLHTFYKPAVTLPQIKMSKIDLISQQWMEISGKKWSVGGIIKQQNYMEIAESVLLSLYMRNNEKVQCPSHPWAPDWVVLNIQHLKVLGPMILKDQKNITTLKWSKRLPHESTFAQPKVVLDLYRLL
jgi:hypothetical protein